MKRAAGLGRRLVPAIVIGAVVLIALAAISDWPKLVAALQGFDKTVLVTAVALTTLNYCIRFLRWQLLLRASGVNVPVGRSASVFTTGLAMSVTPAKLGELVKCFMLRDRDGVRVSMTAPVVIAERFTDVIAVLALVGVGVVAFPAGRIIFAAGVVAVVVGFVALNASPRLADLIGERLSRSLFKGRDFGWAQESAALFRVLLRLPMLSVSTALGVAAWSAECLAFWLVLRGFGVMSVSFVDATFVYAASTLVGALSMLPGGLGATEMTMAGLLDSVGLVASVASAAILVIRCVTLWWGVLLGGAAYLLDLSAARIAVQKASDVAQGASE